MERLESLLQPLYRQLALENRLHLARLRQRWQVVFDEPLCAHTYPAELKDGCLVVTVDSPGWLQQLKFYRPAIIEKLKEYDVTDVRFRSGRTPHERRARSDASALPRPLRSLSDAERVWISSVISTINDSELREQMRKAMERSMQRPREK